MASSRYIYTDKLVVDLDYALPVLYLAKKYMLTKLSNEVVQKISKLLTAQNVCQLLQSAGLAEEIRDMYVYIRVADGQQPHSGARI